jgi:hypothetical protein
MIVVSGAQIQSVRSSKVCATAALRCEITKAGYTGWGWDARRASWEVEGAGYQYYCAIISFRGVLH